MRGSPHIHMLIWIKDSPKFDDNEQEEVIKFVDKYVTCEKSKDVIDLVGLQTHSHSRTCKKNNKPVCRFNFPLPPIEHTCILEPLQADSDDLEGDKKHKSNFEKINKFM